MNAEGYNTKQKCHRDIPVDERLPGLSALLDAEWVRVLLGQRLGGIPGKIEDCRVSYIRYKPATSCIIAYTLKCSREIFGRSSQYLLYAKVYSEANFQIALEKTRVHRWVNLLGTDPVISLPENRAILFLFPNDLVIDGLRVLSDPKKVQRILYEHFDKYPEKEWRISDRSLRLTTVRYKPERRVVLYCKTRVFNRRTKESDKIRAYLRLYADDRGADVFSLQKNLYMLAKKSRAFMIARPIAYLPERRLLIMKDLRGKPLLDALMEGQGLNAIARVAKALVPLHRAEIHQLTERRFDSYLDDAKSTAEMLRYIAPEVADCADEILSNLENYRYLEERRKFGFVHGDFYYGQALLQKNSVAFIDFDRSHLGDVNADIGNFCAHLRLLCLQGRLTNGAGLEKDFKRIYQEASAEKLDKDSVTFWTAYGLFQLSVGPFRRLETGWRKKTENLLEECRKILS